MEWPHLTVGRQGLKFVSEDIFRKGSKMTKYLLPTGAATLVALAATGAQADVTPQQVWDDMQAYMEGFGYEITATEQTSGDTLTLTDMTASMEMPEDSGGGNFTVVMDSMSFVDNGDGTVDVTFPPNVPITFDVTPPDEEPVSGRIDYMTSGFAMTISGDPDAMVYDFSADSLTMALAEITAEGESLSSDDVRAEMTLSGLLGRSEMGTRDGLRDIAQSMTAEELSYDIFMDPPDEDGELSMTGALTGLNFEGTNAFPSGVDFEEMAAALEAGFATQGTFTHEGGSTDFTFTEEGSSVTGSSSSESGSFGITLNDEEVGYRIAGSGLSVEASGDELPFPVSAEMSESLFDISLPVGPAEEPSDFTLALTLRDLSVSEQIWSMIDPQGTLSHEPATVSFDITGMARPLVNIFDPEQMEALGGGDSLPAEVQSLSLNDLLVSIAGARLSGAGDFTFDNDDLQTFQGMPRPEGEVNLTLQGANQLMDKLVQMGLLPEDQVMGARMMLGMFAVPGEGEDTMTSTIEITPEGQVLANGQRIR